MAQDVLDQDEELEDDTDGSNEENEDDDSSDQSGGDKSGKGSNPKKNLDRVKNTYDKEQERKSGDKGEKTGDKNQDRDGKKKPEERAKEGEKKPSRAQRKFDKRNQLKDLKKQKQQGLTKATEEAGEKGAQSILKEPHALAIIGIIIVAVIIIILIIVIIMIVLDDESKKGSATSPLTLTITGPDQARNGDELPYQINAVYAGTAQDVVVTNRIPDGTDYVSSNPVAVFDPATRTATWSLKTIVAPSTDGTISNLTNNLTITIRATRDNTALVNMAQGTIIGEVITEGAANTPDANLNSGL